MPAKRKSVETLYAHGTFRADRHARRVGKINFRPHSGDAPKYLSKLARAEWKRVAPALLAEQMLSAPDEPLLAAYCEAVAGYKESISDIAQRGRILSYTATTRNGSVTKRYANPACEDARRCFVQMRDGAARFGLSPLDRERIEGVTIESPPDSGDDDNDAALFAAPSKRGERA